MNWSELTFQYYDVNAHVEYIWQDGSWDAGKLVEKPEITMHVGAQCLHYGQAAFEGLKAFRGKDGKIRVFRLEENAKRLSNSAQRTMMADISEDLFKEAVTRAVEANEEFVPPYGTGGSLYIRPLLIGSGPMLAVAPATEYRLLIIVTPVGTYYKDGVKAVDACIVDGFDRAAPNGVGHVKVAGNYAASLVPSKEAKDKGFPINLYLDSKEHTFIDEFGTSNFIAIKGNKYITPESSSILPSITNKTLIALAEDQGMEIERRPVRLDEIEDFDTIAACGTAVIITPVHKVVTSEKTYTVGDGSLHPKLEELYNTILAIQFGETEDKFNWNTVL